MGVLVRRRPARDGESMITLTALTLEKKSIAGVEANSIKYRTPLHIRPERVAWVMTPHDIGMTLVMIAGVQFIVQQSEEEVLKLVNDDSLEGSFKKHLKDHGGEGHE